MLMQIEKIRKHPLCGYILGVLTHSTAWHQHLESDKTLKSLNLTIGDICNTYRDGKGFLWN